MSICRLQAPGQLTFRLVLFLAAGLAAYSQQTISVTPPSLSFSAQLGASQPPSQTVQVTSAGSGLGFTATVATSSGGNWLYAYPTNSYNTPATLNVGVQPTVVPAAGTYSGTVTVTAAGNNPIVVTVTFTVSGNTLSVSPTSLSFSAQLGASQPPSQTVQVTSAGSGLGFTATVATSSGGNWLYAYPTNSYNTPATLNVGVQPTVVPAAGTYSGTVTVTAAGNSPIIVTVTFTVSPNILSVTPPGNWLDVWPGNLSFSHEPGAGQPSAQPLTIASVADGLGYSAAVATGSDWLHLTGATGTTPVSASVSVNAAGLAAGTHSGSIAVTATGAANSPVTIPVLLSIGSGQSGELVTVAGTGVPGFSGDSGAAIDAQIDYTYATAVDVSGNIYIADTANHRVRRIGLDGGISTVAGTGTEGSSGLGGLGTSAQLSFPRGIATDSAGDVYIADSGNFRVVKLSPDGTLSAFAGNGSEGYSGDRGPAANAQLRMPRGLAADSRGSLYISDSWNFRLRKVDATGIITTVAGTGNNGYSGDGGAGASADLGFIQAVAVDDRTNTIYVSDVLNSVVRAIDGASGLIRTVAGTGSEGFGGDAGSALSAQLHFPRGLAVDSLDELYIADSFNNRLRRVDASGIITTVAGTLVAGFSGDFLPALQSEMYNPYGLAADVQGNLYVSDLRNYMVREALFGASSVPTLSGLSPASIGAGGSPLTLTVSGIGFLSGATVQWNGSALPTNYVSGSQLTASVAATLIAAPGSVSVSVLNPGNAASNALTFTIKPPPAPSISASGIVNAASYVNGPVSPGEFVSIFGTSIGPANASVLTLDSTGKVATSIGGVTVSFSGYLAPLTYVGPTQINAIVPYEIAGNSSPSVQVTFSGVKSNQVSLQLTTAAPAIFTQSSGGTGAGAILNQDNQLNTQQTPAAKGSTIQIFMTGEGLTTPAQASGAVTPVNTSGSGPITPAPQLAISVLIGGQPAKVDWDGEAPSLVAGVLQVNADVPPTASSGANSITVQVGANISQSGVTVWVQ
jgi:uncharacterized protein (TIGR03437 family)